MGKRGGGGGGGGGAGAKASNARELKMYFKNRMWREHWHLLAGAAVVVVALFAGAVLQFTYSTDHVHRIEVTDAELLGRVLTSGEPWTVLCTRPDDIIPEVFTKAAPRLTARGTFVGVLDCTQRLPASGKSVLAKYGIKSSIHPTVFTVANGEKPKQIFLNYLQSPKALVKRVAEQTRKSAVEILNSAQLESRCLHKPTCVLVLRGNKYEAYERQWLDRLMKEQRTVTFAWVDSTILQLSIESMLPRYVQGEHRLVLFKTQRDPHSKKRQFTAKAYRGVFDLLPVRQFLVENAPTALKSLPKAPTLSRRKRRVKKPVATSEGDGSNGETSNGRKETYAERRRRERRAVEEEQGDEYFFPQATDDPDDDGSRETPSAEEEDNEEEVIDLDAEED